MGVCAACALSNLAFTIGHHLDSMTESISGNSDLYSSKARCQYSMRARGHKYLHGGTDERRGLPCLRQPARTLIYRRRAHASVREHASVYELTCSMLAAVITGLVCRLGGVMLGMHGEQEVVRPACAPIRAFHTILVPGCGAMGSETPCCKARVIPASRAV